jgi:hypothetical protein
MIYAQRFVGHLLMLDQMLQLFSAEWDEMMMNRKESSK